MATTGSESRRKRRYKPFGYNGRHPLPEGHGGRWGALVRPLYGNGPPLQGIRYNGLSCKSVRNRPLDMSSRWFTAIVQDRIGTLTHDPDTGGLLLVELDCSRSIWSLMLEHYEVLETKGHRPRVNPEAEFRALTARVELIVTANERGRVVLMSQEGR